MIHPLALALVLAQPLPSQPPTTTPATVAAPDAPFPPPPPEGSYRAATLALSLGPGWLALHDDIGRDGQRASAFGARLGLVLDPRWVGHIAAEHTRTSRGETTFSQTALLLGVHRIIAERVYVGGALGMAWVHASGPPEPLLDGPGWAYSVGAGVEVLRGEYVALTAELAFTKGHYRAESWEMAGLRVGLLIF